MSINLLDSSIRDGEDYMLTATSPGRILDKRFGPTRASRQPVHGQVVLTGGQKTLNGSELELWAFTQKA